MNDAYTTEFLRRLRDNLNLKKQKEVFEAVLGKALWEILPVGITAKELTKLSSLISCNRTRCKDPQGALKCAKLMIDVMKRTQDSGLQRFHCSSGNGFCVPLKQGNQLYGFIIVSGFAKEIDVQLMTIFVAFTETVMREVQKEMELTKLYDTIRPRAIALSTIHTVHRLISSTLDSDELMPRIARLCLQVMRAESCYIYIFDKDKNKLVIKSAIKLDKDIKGKNSYVKMTGSLARVFNTAASVLKPKNIFVPLIDDDVIGVISVHNKLGDKPFTEFDKEILTTFAEQAVIAIRNAQLYEEQEKLTIGSIKSLAAILDTRSEYTYTHSTAFAKLVVEVAKELKIPVYGIRVLKYASFIHDAGKVMIPDEILKKPKRLTGEEYDIVKKHTIKGVEIVKPIEVLKPIIPIILYHHERYDGTGYPKGLKADQIPLGSRIMSVIDAFMAMVSKQSYRETVSVQEALAEIKKYSGTQFDPMVVDAFLRVMARTNMSVLFRMKSKEF